LAFLEKVNKGLYMEFKEEWTIDSEQKFFRIEQYIEHNMRSMKHDSLSATWSSIFGWTVAGEFRPCPWLALMCNGEKISGW
jgi:hypothetical protein